MSLMSSGRARRGLIVVPAPLKTQWQREWQRFTELPLIVGGANPEEGARILARRLPHSGLQPNPDLPDDTRLWAALQNISGGTWGGCVYDVDQIIEQLGGK